MKQFYLTEIVTRDKLIHQGVFFKPKKPGKRALLWVHGLTDNFYGDVSLYEEFSKLADKTGIAFAVFNNRGHDVVTGAFHSFKPKEKLASNKIFDWIKSL